MAWNPPAAVSAGQVIVSSFLNQIRESLLQLAAAPTSYLVASSGVTAFAWTASTTNPSIGNGSIAADWSFLGAGQIDFRIRITMGSTTTYGAGTWLFQLPVLPAMLGNEGLQSSVFTFDASAANASSRRVGAAYVNNPTSGTIALIDAANDAAVTPTAPITWAVNDVLTITGRYIAA